jgi:hypothetical protein
MLDPAEIAGYELDRHYYDNGDQAVKVLMRGGAVIVIAWGDQDRCESVLYALETVLKRIHDRGV